MEPNEYTAHENQLLEVEKKLLMFKTMMQGIQVNIAELEKTITDIKNKVIPKNHIQSNINLEDNKTPEKHFNKECIKKDTKDNIDKFNNENERFNKEEKEGSTKIIDNYKEKLFNYKEFKPKDNIKNISRINYLENNNLLKKEDSSWLKKEDINHITETKIVDIKKNSENKLINKLIKDPQPSIFDELFDEDKPIKSKLSEEDEIIDEIKSNKEEEDDDFLNRKRVIKNRPKSAYNNIHKLRKVKIQPKSYLMKRTNPEYKKELENNNELIDLEINLTQEEDHNEFYSIKGSSNKGFINTNKAKEKRKEFKGYQCTICHQFYNVLGENLENICDKCTKFKTSYKFESTPQDYYDCNI